MMIWWRSWLEENLEDLYQKHEDYSDDIILKVEKLASGKEVKNVDFELKKRRRSWVLRTGWITDEVKQ